VQRRLAPFRVARSERVTVVVIAWTRRTACALQAALRLSNQAFAANLGIGVRTVADWHEKPGLQPRPETQLILDWLDLGCALTADHDRLRLAGPAADCNNLLDAGEASAAVQRLAEILVSGTRFADMPLYRLIGIDAAKGEISGSLGVTQFASYALTLDLLEGELCDALTAGVLAVPGSLPLRDRYSSGLTSSWQSSHGEAPLPHSMNRRPMGRSEKDYHSPAKVIYPTKAVTSR
jgi:hypothetical protein